MLFFTVSIPAEVVFAEHTLQSGAGGYGALLSSWGVGAVAGSAAYARWRKRPSRQLIAIGAGALGVGFAVMAAAPVIAVAVVGSVIAGVGNGIESVAARTALQEEVEPQWMALMMGFNESMFQLVPGLGILLGGAVASLAGPRVTLAIGAAGSLVVTAVVWIVLRPGVLRAESDPVLHAPGSNGADGPHDGSRRNSRPLLRTRGATRASAVESPGASVRRACIDIGSNTTRLLVAACDRGRLEEVHQERSFTQLRRGVLDGRPDQSREDRRGGGGRRARSSRWHASWARPRSMAWPPRRSGVPPTELS